jgi:2-phospho-L-lactate guanylyltransferase
LDQVFVVSSDQEALRLARGAGATALAEVEQRSESASVDWGAARCETLGARAVLILPADLPLLRAEDVEAVLAAGREEPGVVLVPSADGLGSNAILRRPPLAIPSRFGHGSFARHQREVAQRGLRCAVLRLSRVALDVDEVEHLEALLAGGQIGELGPKPFTQTHALLQRLCVVERLSARLAI